MKTDQIKRILNNYYHFVSTDALRELSSLLDENGVGVSDSCEKHGDLPHVRKRNASGETDKSIDESEQITLGKRIDSEKLCRECGGIISPSDMHLYNGLCWNCGHN